MNCARCHHSDMAHSGDGDSLMRRGACSIPGCRCDAFVDAILRIDEDLV